MKWVQIGDGVQALQLNTSESLMKIYQAEILQKLGDRC